MARACSTSAVIVAVACAAACGDDSIVLTIAGRDTVREVAAVEVAVEDDTGARESARFAIADGALDKTVTIATTGRSGDLAISVRAVDDRELLVAIGEVVAPAAGDAAVTVVLDPAEFGLNDRVVGAQALTGDDALAGAQLATLPDGTAFAAWESDEVMARLFDAHTRPVANATELTPLEFPVAADTTDGIHPSVAVGPDGWVVTWEHRAGLGVRDIAARVFAHADADPISLFDEPVASTGGVNFAPDAFALADGRFGVTWISEGPGPGFQTEAFVQLLSDAGAAMGPSFAVSAGDGGREFGPDGLALAGGGFVVVWLDGSERLLGRVFDETRAALTGDLSLNDGGAFAFVSHARAVALPTGGFAVAYVQSGDEGSFLQLGLFDDRGAPTQLPVRVADVTGVGGVDVAVRAGDRAIALAWDEGGASEAGADVYLRVYDSTGQPCGDAQVVHVERAGNQRGPSVAPFGIDAFMVAWTDESGRLHDPSMSGVAGRIVYPTCE